MNNYIALLLQVIGALSTLAGAYAIVVFPDVLSRMHGATKPQILGLFCFCLSFIINEKNIGTALIIMLIWGVQIITIPVATHLIGRAAHRTDDFKKSNTIIDELSPLYESSS